jgi:hypothetical protein
LTVIIRRCIIGIKYKNVKRGINIMKVKRISCLIITAASMFFLPLALLGGCTGNKDKEEPETLINIDNIDKSEPDLPADPAENESAPPLFTVNFTGSREITAMALGEVYDMNDGRYNQPTMGDTWAHTWLANGDVYMTWNDGTGFDNQTDLHYRHFFQSGLAKLVGNPNYNTITFGGQNLNPGSLGDRRNNPFGYYGYAYNTGVIEYEGVLYNTIIGGKGGSLIYSYDGGINWHNQYGQENIIAMLDNADKLLTTGFISGPIRFGQGDALPDGLPPQMEAEKYMYISFDYARLARVERANFAHLNRDDWQYLTGLDDGGAPQWSNNPNDADFIPGLYSFHASYGTFSPRDVSRPTSTGFMTYNEHMKKFLQVSWSAYYPPNETASYDAWTAGYTRYHIYAADYPWGPFIEINSAALRGSTVLGPILMPNKYTSADGKKMWLSTSGGWPPWEGWKNDHSPWLYGFQYMPVYFSRGETVSYKTSEAGGVPVGDGLKFNISQNILETGWHIIRIAYTNPDHHNNTMSVYVNGRKARTLTLSRNGRGWANDTNIYWLEKGTGNIIEIKCDVSAGNNVAGVLIDSVTVSSEATYNEGENIAPQAAVSQSSGTGTNAVKGHVDYFTEWKVPLAVKGQVDLSDKPWIQLDWAAPQTINKIVLYDLYTKNGGEGFGSGFGNNAVTSTNRGDQVIAGTLTFSDGTAISIGKLQNDGMAGSVVTFPEKSAAWVRFTIDEVGTDTANAGLGEIMIMHEPGITPPPVYETTADSNGDEPSLKFANTDGKKINLVFDRIVGALDAGDIMITPINGGDITVGALNKKITGAGAIQNTGIPYDTNGMVWSLELAGITTPGDFQVAVAEIPGTLILTVRSPGEYAMRELVQTSGYAP